jgi:hypothetical protein
MTTPGTKPAVCYIIHVARVQRETECHVPKMWARPRLHALPPQNLLLNPIKNVVYTSSSNAPALKQSQQVLKVFVLQ